MKPALVEGFFRGTLQRPVLEVFHPLADHNPGLPASGGNSRSHVDALAIAQAARLMLLEVDHFIHKGIKGVIGNTAHVRRGFTEVPPLANQDRAGP